MTPADESDEALASRRSAMKVEWFIAGISAVLVLVLIGLVFYEAVAGGSIHPNLAVRTDRIERDGDDWRVLFTLANTGGRTAAAVEVAAVLEGADGNVERARVTFDYSPPHSERKGAFLFSRDPSAGALRMRAEGYASP